MARIPGTKVPIRAFEDLGRVAMDVVLGRSRKVRWNLCIATFTAEDLTLAEFFFL